MLARELGFRPLGDEIGQPLGLDGLTWAIQDLKRGKFNGPLRNSTSGISVVDDVVQLDLRGHHYGAFLEVMLKFLISH